jgi:hypothetical protein
MMRMQVRLFRLACATFLALMVGLAGVCSAAPENDVSGAIDVSPQVKPPKAPKAPKEPKVPKAPKADTKAPKVRISSPKGGARRGVVGTITVTATARDKVGVAGVQFLLDGAPLQAEVTVAPFEITWNTTTVADGPHTLAADARDEAGNIGTSPPVTVTVANATPVPAPARLEEAAAVLAPPGAWQLATPADTGTELSGDTAAFSFEAGATATFTFTGTGVTWFGVFCDICGTANALLDGAPVEVNTFAVTSRADVVFERSGLAAGSHTLVIEVLGDGDILVDAFDVTP